MERFWRNGPVLIVAAFAGVFVLALLVQGAVFLVLPLLLLEGPPFVRWLQRSWRPDRR